jgi:hypothetical protein
MQLLTADASQSYHGQIKEKGSVRGGGAEGGKEGKKVEVRKKNAEEAKEHEI